MGFTNSSHDPCFDNIVLAHKSPGKLKQFVDDFTGFTGPKGFRAKHVGPLTWFLGVEVDQAPDHSITINQRQYLPYNPLTFKQLTTTKTDDERDRMIKLPYLQFIDSLLYLSTMTYPEIAYQMSILYFFYA